MASSEQSQSEPKPATDAELIQAYFHTVRADNVGGMTDGVTEEAANEQTGFTTYQQLRDLMASRPEDVDTLAAKRASLAQKTVLDARSRRRTGRPTIAEQNANEHRAIQEHLLGRVPKQVLAPDVVRYYK